MIIRRTNLSSPGEAAKRLHGNAAKVGNHHVPISASPLSPAAPIRGDVIYGARAIAVYLFADDSDRARRRVFNLAAHYMARDEPAGFFKLKGALCLSKSRWAAFHKLG